jgi:type I restriction enzyme S subunit
VIETVRLGEICHTTSGGTPSRSRQDFFGGAIPWVKSGNLNDGVVGSADEFITEAGLSSSSAKIFPAGTLLIAMYGATVGKLGILAMDAATNQAVCGIQPTEKIDRDFLFHLLLFRRKELVGKSVGGAQPNISQAIIRDTLVPLPPLDEQRRIVGLLDRAAEIRRRADAARAKARAIIPALFLDTFGDPATNPKGWKSVALDEVCDLVRGSSPRPQGDPRFFGGPVPRLMISDITRDGAYVTPRTDSLTIEGANRSRPMKAGDVVMAVSGAVGLPAILTIDACIHDGFVGFRNLRREITAQCFYYFLLAALIALSGGMAHFRWR